ncbi:uncharacterized protein LOC129715174 [Leucoraja erinacea]|uniref:uncharacterized protein LOC129715174 n=1 Tax=Leucoraja erinaceus TaxID=7782 RepID=UPI002456E754|nr:uncharacterized protein LOC129715174 [Leucoraja erinacea]
MGQMGQAQNVNVESRCLEADRQAPAPLHRPARAQLRPVSRALSISRGARQQAAAGKHPSPGTRLRARQARAEARGGRMKSRSSLPAFKIYLSEATPVCVYIQKPKLLPSIVERPDRPLETIFDKIENEQMNQSGHQVDRVMKDLKQLKNKLNTSGEQFAEDLIDSAKSKCLDEDLEAKQSWELSRTIYRHGDIWESFGKLQKEQNLNRKENESLTEENKLVVALKEAETASIAAENQVATLKNSIVELIQVSTMYD